MTTATGPDPAPRFTVSLSVSAAELSEIRAAMRDRVYRLEAGARTARTLYPMTGYTVGAFDAALSAAMSAARRLEDLALDTPALDTPADDTPAAPTADDTPANLDTPATLDAPLDTPATFPIDTSAQ